jgi:hypothetical protein
LGTASIKREILERIWAMPGNHVPAIHTDWWEDVAPNNFRASALAVDHPVAVTERRALPESLQFRSNLVRLMAVGEALLYAVFDPMLHFSLVGRRLVYASGVTILLVERRKDGEITTVPWSLGESRKIAMERLIRCRKLPPPRLNAQESYVAANLLPRCQAAVSAVSGIENPGTNILASGGECPISVVVGEKNVHFALDHRIYDPDAAAVLYYRMFSVLKGSL